MHSGKVLIIDDEPSLLNLLSSYLSRRGYTVAAFSCADAAWRDFAADPGAYATVLLDMSGLGAEEFGERALLMQAKLRVIASSGMPTDLSRLKAAGRDRVTFLQKPFTPEMLAESIARFAGA